MFYQANPADLPSPHLPKRVVFYAAALKVYGVLPFLLNRRVQGAFVSHSWSIGGGGSVSGPTAERDYTLILYQQSPAAVQALLDWLYADAGFEWGVAANFHTPLEDLRSPNLLHSPAVVWHVASGAQRQGFSDVLQRQSQHKQDIYYLKGT